jgi:hypothetical protein
MNHEARTMIRRVLIWNIGAKTRDKRLRGLRKAELRRVGVRFGLATRARRRKVQKSYIPVGVAHLKIDPTTPAGHGDVLACTPSLGRLREGMQPARWPDMSTHLPWLGTIQRRDEESMSSWEMEKQVDDIMGTHYTLE